MRFVLRAVLPNTIGGMTLPVLAWLRRRSLLSAPLFSAWCLHPSDHELGTIGEELAARHFARLGWRVEGRQLRVRDIEVDLLCRDRDVLVCVEVKTGWSRARDGYRPLDRVTPRRLRRQRRAARELARRVRGVSSWRVDVVEVRLGRSLSSPRIEHLRDAGFRNEPADR